VVVVPHQNASHGVWVEPVPLDCGVCTVSRLTVEVKVCHNAPYDRWFLNNFKPSPASDVDGDTQWE